jgi:hypothetical protein
VNEVSSSRYIYIRENSIEYNTPTLQPAKATTPLSTVLCCGNSPSELVVRDQVTVLYFDDIIFDSVRNDTRLCNPFITFCCGGHGETVQLESTYCWDMCYRSRGCGGICCIIPCIPVICPDCVCPCAARVRVFFVLVIVGLPQPLSLTHTFDHTHYFWYHPHTILENNIRRGCRNGSKNHIQSKR